MDETPPTSPISCGAMMFKSYTDRFWMTQIRKNHPCLNYVFIELLVMKIIRKSPATFAEFRRSAAVVGFDPSDSDH